MSGFNWAVKTGDLAGVKDAVERDGEDVNQVEASVSKRTPMHWAADFGQVEVMKYLVSKGAKPDVADHFGITPLLAAVYEGHDEAVKFLLEKGANKNAKGPDGLTALEAATKESTKQILRSAGGGAAAPAGRPVPPPRKK
eukprot:TRINITY_DN1169_c0_g1_i1.p1 TRINITY_DN1169_c0_g1~~TRINITY_DN1169_c0_g1_i1.p1  ORF type:complete len:140 (+),score=41.16 TRINITY_DN1169_c0_g1_i1:145-564(+)